MNDADGMCRGVLNRRVEPLPEFNFWKVKTQIMCNAMNRARESSAVHKSLTRSSMQFARTHVTTGGRSKLDHSRAMIRGSMTVIEYQKVF